jgi:hypothetical protein
VANKGVRTYAKWKSAQQLESKGEIENGGRPWKTEVSELTQSSLRTQSARRIRGRVFGEVRRGMPLINTHKITTNT